jgi:hypothetical protein
MGVNDWCSIPGRGVEALTTAFRPALGAHPATSFLGVLRQEDEADHSLSFSAEVKKAWRYISTFPYVFIL